MISRLMNTKFKCAMARVILDIQFIEDQMVTLVEAFLVTV